MTTRLLVNIARLSNNVPKRFYYHYGPSSKIGKREIVGFGFNGEPSYIDTEEYPFPAIRYKEPTPDVMALREKEKGDWKKLSIEDKKALYRASFRQTFAEINAPNGQWKGVIGYSCLGVTMALWFYIWLRTYVYSPLPASFSEENQREQLELMIGLNMAPVTGGLKEIPFQD